MRARVLTAALLLPPVVAVAWSGGWPLAGLLVIVTAAASWEALPLVLAAGSRPPGAPGRLLVGVAGVLPVLAAALAAGSGLASALGAATLAAAVWAVLVTGAGWWLAREAAERWRLGGAAAILAFWVGWPLAHALELRQAGPWALLGPLLIVWAQDIAAFFAGRAWGRHRLAPRVSPGKTWEGAMAGLAAALLVAVLLAAPLAAPPAALVPVGLLTGLAGQAGDLFESAWKRRAGRKDSGRLLPGHGGVLDRIDSVLFALPVFTWSAGLFLKVSP